MIADQRQFHCCLLSAAEASMVRVLSGLIHTQPGDRSYKRSSLTHFPGLELASHNVSARLNERRAGEVSTSLGLMNRTRSNAGYYLWLDHTDRARTRQLVSVYEVDCIPPASGSKCEFCTQAETAVPQTDTPVVSVVEQAGLERPKHQRGARRERRSSDGILVPVGSPKRSHQT